MITYKDLPIKRGEKIKLTVTMEVSAAQAYALQEMFKCWNFYGKAGMSRRVAFYADGDGDFHPNCEVKTEPALPELDRVREGSRLAVPRTRGTARGFF